MTRSAWYRKALTTLVTVGLFVSQIGGIVASAAATTPFGAQRFAKDHATYVITTKSDYYKSIWRSAIDAWNATGAFKFKSSSSSKAQITLGIASKSESKKMGNDVGLTEFWARDNYFVSVNSLLNARLIKEYDYSRSDAIHVAEHELGHAMGLAHNPSTKSVMYYRNRAVGIQSVDINGVRARYQTPAGRTN